MMVTNDKEYQKAYQREYRKTHPQKQYRKSKEVKIVSKEVKNKMLDISLERLRPPAKVETSFFTPTSSVKPIGKKINENDSKTLGIDFSYLTNNHSFQMAVLEFMKRFAPGLENIKVRGNKQALKQSFNENANNYRNVMTELKEVLERRKK